MEYPITISGIKWGECKAYGGGLGFLENIKVGSFVAIRPCAEEYGNKTYLGVYLGSFAQSISAQYNKESQELQIDFTMHNPTIFIPDLNKVIFGYESWWGTIKSPEQLRQITDEDINNIWYVKALKQLTENQEQMDDHRKEGETSNDKP